MIEVYPHGNGWRWRLICQLGRTLVDFGEHFPCNLSAASSAKAWRKAFMSRASSVDHRQAACI